MVGFGFGRILCLHCRLFNINYDVRLFSLEEGILSTKMLMADTCSRIISVYQKQTINGSKQSYHVLLKQVKKQQQHK